MVKLNKQIKPMRTCFECMLISVNNLGTNSYSSVNLHITKDCKVILVVICEQESTPPLLRPSPGEGSYSTLLLNARGKYMSP